MPTLLLRFPGRRYHATPWGHHVNEGLVEWPPSPWRVLRALLSVGYASCGWAGEVAEPWRSVPPEPARSALLALAGVAPRYRLPAAVGAHSRHYMPTADFKDGKERTTLVFDTWAQVDSGELAITWDVELDEQQTQALDDLVSRLGYLGRSESWVVGRLASQPEVEALDHGCAPCGTAPPPGPGWEQVALLAPANAADYARWREARVEHAVAVLPPVPGRSAAARKREAARDAVRDPYPADVLACLQVDTAWLRQHGWSQPPGSVKLLYWRRAHALDAASPPVPAAGTRAAVTCALLSLTNATLNSHALPTLARTLPQAELLHRQALGVFGRMSDGGHSVVLSGCDENRRPLRGAHEHAHLLPFDLDGDGHLDHLLIWAPGGLPAAEQQALRRLRGTYMKGGAGDLRLAWAGAGALADLAAMPAPLGDGLRRSISPARRWVSATPFVPPRYLKTRGRNTLEGQVRAELIARGCNTGVTVEVLDPQHSDHARRLRHHLRVRRFGPAPVVDVGFALRLSFEDAVPGPLCLGYGSHFGLGRFEHDAPAA